MRLYLVQHDIVWEDPVATFAGVQALLDAAPPRAGSLIVLPEMFSTGFSDKVSVTLCEDGGETQQWLGRLARQHQCGVVAGIVGRDRVTGQAQNLALLLDTTGREVARYAKRQPFSLGGETSVHAAGDAATTVQWHGACLGLMICYDLRFPELARDCVKQGAEVLIYIASWPEKRAQHWVTLLQARAIENQAWVIGVNRCGTDPHFAYPGRTMVVDPHGVIRADAGAGQGGVEMDLDIEVARQWRRDFPALRDAGLL
jgi:omega-amidase